MQILEINLKTFNNDKRYNIFMKGLGRFMYMLLRFTTDEIKTLNYL